MVASSLRLPLRQITTTGLDASRSDPAPAMIALSGMWIEPSTRPAFHSFLTAVHQLDLLQPFERPAGCREGLQHADANPISEIGFASARPRTPAWIGFRGTCEHFAASARSRATP